MKSCIHFIRHGITEGIQNRWYYGATDMPLVQEGFDALEVLKSEGIYPLSGNADCYTSGMLRANQTFETIYGDAKYREIPDLREMNFGLWECKTFDQLKEMDLFDEWINDKTGTFVFPEGDSTLGFYKRIYGGLDELLGYHRIKEQVFSGSDEEAVSIIVCHGGVISACLSHLFGFPPEEFWKWIPKPGRGFSVYFEDGKPSHYEAI